MKSVPAAVPNFPNLKPYPAWASLPLFYRKGWQRTEFAESFGERAEAPKEIYRGLEHPDPQCLHIRRLGKGGDGIGGNQLDHAQAGELRPPAARQAAPQNQAQNSNLSQP